MRKLVISSMVGICLCLAAQAQTEKGDWLVGGNLQLNTSSSNTMIGFTPMAGWFIVNNLAIGGNIVIDYTKSGDNKSTDFGIGPLVRYYFGTTNVRPFLHGDFNYISSKLTTPLGSSTNNGSNFFLGAGAAFFINENIAVEAIAGYDHASYINAGGSGGFKLSVGFQVYLSKHQVASLKQ